MITVWCNVDTNHTNKTKQKTKKTPAQPLSTEKKYKTYCLKLLQPGIGVVGFSGDFFSRNIAAGLWVGESNAIGIRKPREWPPKAFSHSNDPNGI